MARGRRSEDTAGERLRRARLASKISQAELSKRTGIDRATLSAYENGRRAAGPDNAEKLSRELGVSAKSLTGWTGLGDPEVQWRRRTEERLAELERRLQAREEGSAP